MLHGASKRISVDEESEDQTGRIANPAGMHRHINHLFFDVLGVARIGIVQEKGAAMLWALAAAVALLALRGLAMAHNIGPLAVMTVQDWRNHSTT